MHLTTVTQKGASPSPSPQPTVVVVIPALNEGQIIGQVVRDLCALCNGDVAIIADIFVCDNGSADDTALQAVKAGATVVTASRKGYGSACLAGLEAIAAMRPQPDIVLFADGDGSVVAKDVPMLLQQIDNGFDLVIGVRVPALQERGALTPPQRVGNAVASWLIFALWRQWVSDLGPLRAMRTDALWRLHMADKTFGWTVEMQIKALQARMRVAEVPVSTLRRVGKSKISGTVSGVIGAAKGIIGKIFALKIAEWKTPRVYSASRPSYDGSARK
jgi:glycosyltransferase involved in cell wall biosynthesis